MNERMKEYLCHMTDAEKKAYNAEYYRNHKNYWEDYYSKGRTVGRPTSHQKDVVQGGNGVKRRGEALGTGQVGSFRQNTIGPSTKGVQVSNDPSKDSKERKELARNYQNRLEERKAYMQASNKLKARFKAQINSAGQYKAAGNDKKAQQMLDLAEKSKREYESYDKMIEDYDKNKIPAAREALARYDALSEMHNSGQMNPNKPSVQVKKTDMAKEKVKSKAKQAASDWKAGAKGISSMAKDSVESGKKAFSKLLSKFR